LANAYYLINADQVEQARACAQKSGASHDVFSVRLNNDGTKALVQANWLEDSQPPGVLLGNFNGGEVGERGFYEMAKTEGRHF